MQANTINTLDPQVQQPISICLISASPEVLIGINDLLEDEDYKIEQVLANDDHSQAILRFEKIRAANIVILDLSTTGSEMFDVLHQVQTIQPRAQILALHLFSDRSLARSFIEAGARGYLPVNTSIEELREALEEIIEGQTFISRRVA